MKNRIRILAAFLAVVLLFNSASPQRVYAENEYSENIAAETNAEITPAEETSSEAEGETDTEITEAVPEEENIETQPEIVMPAAGLEEDEGIALQAEDEEIALQAEDEGIALQAEEEGISLAEYLTVLQTKNYGSYTDNGTTRTISCDGNEALVLLSHVKASEYQDVKIVAPTGNNFILTDDKLAEMPSGEKVSFIGLGSPEYPFKGSIQAGTITIDRALYNGVSDAVITNGAAVGPTADQTILWKGEDGGSVIADCLVLENAKTEARYLNLCVKADRTLSGLFGKIRTADGQTVADAAKPGLYITGSAINLNGNNINVQQKENNAGFICGTLESGNIYLQNLTIAPDSFKISGNIAGALIGQMCEGSGLTICDDMTLSVTEVYGTSDAGGIVGKVKDSTITVEEGRLVTWKVSSIKGINVGGLYGSYTSSQSESFSSPIAGFKQQGANKIELYSGDNGSAGGFFGRLELAGGSTISVNEVVISSLERGGEVVSYGGVAGSFVNLTEGEAEPLLTVGGEDRLTLTVENRVTIDNYGGIVGQLEDCCLKAVNLNVNYNMNVSATTQRFGGVAALLGEGAFVDCKDILVKRTGGTSIQFGGGIAGEAKPGSAIRLDGSINVYDVYFDTSKYKNTSTELGYVGQLGQILGYQDSALVFAGSEFTYSRIKSNDKVDDIGNYGQILRKTGETEGIIAVDEGKHSVSLNKPADFSLTNIDSLEDFAYLALSWQTRGVFGEAIASDCDITLGANIDLTNTGITGITRDTRESIDPDLDEPVYTGTIDGANHRITLDIGSVFGTKPSTTSTQKCGTGVVHYHNSLGLFAVFGGTARNLNIDGSAKVIVRQYYKINVGALAGCAEGTAVVENVSVSPDITVQYDTNTSAPCRAGGLFGLIEDWKGDTRVTVSGTFAPTITLNQNYSDYAHFGGVAGLILDLDYKSATPDTTDYTVTLIAADVTVGGELKSSSEVDISRFHAGGLVSDIINGNDDYKYRKNQVIIKKLVLNETITTSATEWSGGLLGALWTNTEVIIESETEDYAISGTGTVDAPNIVELGGLCYHASGKWTLGRNAVDMSEMTLLAPNTEAVGLLVCHGEPGTEAYDTTADNSKTMYALYFLMTENWEEAYKVCADGRINTSAEVFDELIAYTISKTEYNVQTYVKFRNLSGVLSLKSSGAVLKMDGTESNTYQNRTDYGKSVSTNEYARYYYNLDTEYAKIGAGNGYVDTVSELLIWSVFRYGHTNLQQYFEFPDRTKTVGGSTTGSRVTFDLKGISYYPINVDGGMGFTLQYADVVFYNEKIETQEKATEDKKLTSTDTQHEAMHCGLFHNFAEYTGSNTRTNTLTVNGVSFDGTVGKVDGGSGALICGSVYGRFYNGGLAVNKLVLGSSDNVNYAVTLAGVRVTDSTGYAPLLVNHFGSYSELSASYVTWDPSKYDIEGEEFAGSSLIGTVGSTGTEKDVNITLSFQGTMRLPSEIGHTIFSRATLLESFRYQTGGKATYNFVKQKDWKNGNAVHDVTYGYEITGSVENSGRQLWYNDETDDRETNYFVNAVTSVTSSGTDFTTGYLPYVHRSPAKQDEVETFSTLNGYHELQVNLKVRVIVEGCGTFGDPFKITDVNSLEVYAEITRTGKSTKGVEITLVSGAKINELHKVDLNDTDKTDYHVTYRYDGTTVSKEWRKVKADGTLDTNDSNALAATTVLYYFRNAYFDIAPGEYNLESFGGFGSLDAPFRGVLLNSDDSLTTTLILQGDSMPLIPASYGSVVYHLNVQYSGTRELSMAVTDETVSEKHTYSPYSAEAFGAVFGIILGGDNFIDDVTVTAPGGTVSLSGRDYLIPVGGYIGSIVGGGVIFRNMTDTEGVTSLVEKKSGQTYLYVNPFIGRVYDGYALYETDEKLTVTLNNTNNNYQIANINPDTVVTSVSENTISVDDQGLLILASIVNSGGGHETSNAYRTSGNTKLGPYYFGNGTYGKVRNEDYTQIGKITENTYTTVLAQIVRNDNFIAPNTAGNTQGLTGELSYSSLYPGGLNACYLANRYFKKLKPTLLCNAGVNIRLTSDADYTAIQNGWTGLSGRYLSNAAYNTTSQKPDAVLLTVLSLDGGDHTLKVDRQVREYHYDDYHASSFGGLINVLRTNANGGVRDRSLLSNLTISDSTVTFEYIDELGNSRIQSENLSYNEGKFVVSVGGIVGATAGTGTYSEVNNYIVSRLSITDSTISGPYSVGGLFGAVGYGNQNYGAPGKMVSRDKANFFGINMIDCSFAQLEVIGGLAAGGLVGIIGGNSGTTMPRDLGPDSKYLSPLIVSSYTASSEGFITGKNSLIKTTQFESTAGGMFGEVGTALYANDKDYYETNISSTGTAGSCVLENVDVLANPEDNLTRMWIRTNQKYLADEKNASGSWDSMAGYRFDNFAGGISGRHGGNFAFTCIRNVTIRGTGEHTVLIQATTDSSAFPSPLTNVTYPGSYAAGAIAYNYTGAVNTVISGFKTENVSIQGQRDVGGVVGMVNWNSALTSLLMDDICLRSTSVISQLYAGGLLGYYSNKFSASNILLDDVQIFTTRTDASKTAAQLAEMYTGLLVGEYTTSNAKNMYIAGVSVKIGAHTLLPAYEISKRGSISNAPDYTYTGKYPGYVSYTDYEPQAEHGDDVTTNPQIELPGVTLYGDALESGKVFDIYSDTQVKGKSWYYTGRTETNTAYFYQKGINYLTEPMGIENAMLSTYRTEQPDTLLPESYGDFPVLALSGDQLDQIDDILNQYLNIITNDGFALALAEENNETRNLVSARVITYAYDETQNQFVQDSRKASLACTEDSKKVTFRTLAAYDNTRDRFSLVEVTFYVERPGDMADYNSIVLEEAYTLHIPVVIKRTMQVRFEATLSTGMDFYGDGYSDIDNHALENIGNPVTAYLTYEYERDLSNDAQAYDWDKFLSEDGVLMEMDKTIVFADGYGALLPEGTKLTLVDCQRENRVYTYTVGAGGTNSVKLSDFTRGTRELQEHQQSQPLSVLLGAYIDEDAVQLEKKYVETTAENAAVQVGDRFYRLATEEDSAKEHVAIKIPAVRSPREDYFLVWIVPKNSTTENLVLDGAIKTKVDSPVASDLNYAHRYDPTQEDDHVGTESTYNISGGYVIALEDMDNSRTSCEITGTGTPLRVAVKSEIGFYSNQKFSRSDNLYHSFTANLKNQTGEISTFPSENGEIVSGQVYLYVYTADGTYYSWNGSSWQAAGTERKSAMNYRWNSGGGDMVLRLSTDNSEKNSVSLASLRQMFLDSEHKTQCYIYVEAEAELYFSEEALRSIPENLSSDSIENYIQLNYSSQLATKASELSSSSIQARPKDGEDWHVKYYRVMNNQPKLILDCDEINQLGINCSDLEPMYYAKYNGKNTSYIEMNAEYDLSTVQKLEEVLKESTGVTFSLRLERQSGTGPTGYAAQENAGAYIDFYCDQPQTADKVWSWTIPQEEYISNGKLKTDGLFDGDSFNVPIMAYVDTDKSEFANYKIVLSAEINGVSKVGAADGTDAYLIYTFARIAPEFMAQAD